MAAQGPRVINDTNKVSQGRLLGLYVPMYIYSIENDLETFKLVPITLIRLPNINLRSDFIVKFSVTQSLMSRVLAISLFVLLKFLSNNRWAPVALVYKRMQFECVAVRKSRTNYLIYQQKQRELSLVFNH